MVAKKAAFGLNTCSVVVAINDLCQT